MDSQELLLALLGNSNPGTLITPNVENGEGVITFRARKSSSYTVFLSVGYYSGGFIEAVKYTLGSSYQTYTYDFANFGSKISSATNIAFKITSGPNSGVQQLRLDDIEYKSFCQPAANPVALAKDITVKLDATGNVIVNPASVDDGSTDDCGEFITNFSLDKTLFTCDDLGVNAVTLTATDSEGQTATASANVTVEPGFVFNSNQLALDENGESNVELDFLTQSKTDCDAVTYALDRTAFTCADAGNYLFTVTASYNGQTKTFTATKNIADYINPVAIAQDIAVSIDETTGLALVTPEMIDNNSTDNCGVASLALSQTSFDCADLGENEVTLTVTDDAGRASTATAIVTVGSFLADVVLSTNSPTVCFDGSNGSAGATIETDGSTVGTQYYLRNDADSSVVDGPIDGTGSGLSFSTGAVSENTTFHVYGEVPFSGNAIDLTDNGRTAHLSVNTPGGFDYSAGYTISAWLKLGSSGNSTFYNGIFYAGGATGSDIEIYENSTGTITILHNRGNGSTQAAYSIPGNVITNNTYVHFAATYNGLASRIFVNGVEVGAATLAAPTKSGSSEMTFGYLNSTTFPAAQNFPGIVDDIRVYDRALTATDILTDYDKCISGTEDDLVLYFDLETISGSIYTDLVSATPAQLKNGGFSTDDAAISCSFTCNRIMTNKITIGDDLAPVVTTQDISLVVPHSGYVALTPDMIDNGSADNCSDDSTLVYELDITSFKCDDLGDNTVTLTVTDEAGNSATATANVTISSSIEDEVVTVEASNLCASGDETIVSISSSVEGVDYFLRNSVDNAVVDGPISGTGSKLDFNTGAVSAETTFNVFGEIDVPQNLSLFFQTGGSSVSSSIDFDYSAGYTFEAWVKPSPVNTHRAIFSIGNESVSDVEIYIQQGTNDLVVVHDRGETNFGGLGFSDPVFNQWFHLAVTYDGTDIAVYYDGVKQSITQSNFAPTTPMEKTEDLDMKIGEISNTAFGSGGSFFDGQIDEVGIWSSVRSEADILANKDNCLAGSEMGLVTLFKLDEGSGTDIVDSANGNNGILSNINSAIIWVTGSPIECFGCELQMGTEVTVTIGDTEAPTVITRNITVILDTNNSASITADDIDNGSADNCTISDDLTRTLDITSFDDSNLGANTVTLTVADENGNSSTETAEVTVSDKQLQIITFDAISDKVFGDDDFSLTAAADSQLPISFSVVSGNVSLSNDVISITGTGAVTIKAIQAGDDSFAPAEVDRTFTIAKADQVLSGAEISDQISTTSDFTLTASVNSNLTLEYAISSGPATISGNTLSLTGALGTVEVLISQAGNENYNPLSQTVSFEVLDKEVQTVTVEGVANKTFGDSNFGLTATIDSGLPVSFTVVSGGLTITELGIGSAGGGSATFTITGAGEAVIEASNEGDATYAPLLETITIDVAKADQVLNVEEVTNKSSEATPISIVASVDSDLPLTYAVAGPATIAENVVTLSGTLGTVEVTVSQTGNDNYNPASETVSFEVVEKLAQTISFSTTSDVTYGAGAQTLVATSDSNLPVSFAIASGTATLSGDVLTFTKAGTIVIEAYQDGDVDYAAASPVQQTIVVSKAELDIVADNKTIVFGDALPELTISYSGFVSGESEADLNATVSISTTAGGEEGQANAGSYPISISVSPSEAGDNYSFTTQDGTLIIDKVDQVLTLNAVEDKEPTDAAFEVSASVDSELPLTYEVAGPATISGATITLNGTEGTVTVTVSQEGDVNHNAVSASESFEVAVVLAVGDDLGGVKIYPNPVVDHLIVESGEKVSIRFYTLDGKLAKTLSNVTGQVNVQGLKAGTYIIEVSTKDSKKFDRIIKAN